jgi:hypothetical protein
LKAPYNYLLKKKKYLKAMAKAEEVPFVAIRIIGREIIDLVSPYL